jgi:cytochrome c5
VLAFWLLSAAAGAAIPLCASRLPGQDTATAQSAAAQNPQASFDGDIAPVFNKYCIGCHSAPSPRGDMHAQFKDEADARGRAANDDFWSKVSAELSSGRMPPAMVKNRPSDEERKRLVDWINNDVLTIAGKHDPGTGVRASPEQPRICQHQSRSFCSCRPITIRPPTSRPMSAATALTTTATRCHLAGA